MWKLPVLHSTTFNKACSVFLHKMTPGIHLGKGRDDDFGLCSWHQCGFLFVTVAGAMAHETQDMKCSSFSATLSYSQLGKAASVMQRSSPPCLFEVMAWIWWGNMASSTQFSLQRGTSMEKGSAAAEPLIEKCIKPPMREGCEMLWDQV